MCRRRSRVDSGGCEASKLAMSSDAVQTDPGSGGECFNHGENRAIETQIGE